MMNDIHIIMIHILIASSLSSHPSNGNDIYDLKKPLKIIVRRKKLAYCIPKR